LNTESTRLFQSKEPNYLRAFLIAAIALFVILIVILAFTEPSGQLLPASTLAYATCFLLTIYFLKNRMSSMFDVLLTATATTFSGVWLYELVYHYFWGSSLASLFSDFSHFSVTIYPGWPFPVWFALPVILFPLLKKQYITLNKPLLVTLAVSMGLFALWFNLGFPQFFYPQYYYGPLLTPAQVRDIGYVMNSLSKLLAIVPAFLFCEKGKFTWRQVEANQILQDFKNAFLLLLFGGLLVSLPLVGSIGLILIIAGISILLLSINGLGKFDFPQFTQFRFNCDNCSSWILYTVSNLHS
jgi:hypothetical protein